jgi:hypothetical protein
MAAQEGAEFLLHHPQMPSPLPSAALDNGEPPESSSIAPTLSELGGPLAMASKSSRPPLDGHFERGRDALSDDLARVRDALKDLKYGAVTLVVQDGVLVQIDRTEKIRFRRGNGS